MPESPQTPIVRLRKRMKMYDTLSNELGSDSENIEPIDSNQQWCDYSNPKRNLIRTPLLQTNLNQSDQLEINQLASPNPTNNLKFIPRKSCLSEPHLLLPSTEFNKLKSNSNEREPKMHPTHWNTMDTAQSPWPYLEVDQLAKLLTSSVTISPIAEFKSNIKSNESDEIWFSDPTYTSSSNSSVSYSSEEDTNAVNTNELKNCPPVGCKFRKSSKSSPRQRRKPWEDSQFHKPNRSQRFIVIDCRYPYEFNGGHIRGALNLAEWPKLRRFLFSSLENQKNIRLPTGPLPLSPDQTSSLTPLSRPSRTVFVLHCEFSSHRAPKLFSLIRNHDRLLHFDNYPLLRYPKVYVLRGGYAAFYSNYPELCEPSSYLRMHSRPDLLGLWRRHCERVNRHCDSDEDDDKRRGS